MSLCAIHQPNFFPWSGFFDKIDKADIFIFLDEVAYPKSGSGSGSWCNRVKLINAGQPGWYGLPIKKTSGVQLINAVSFSDKPYHLDKFKRTLQHNYQKTPYYQAIMTELDQVIHEETDSLSEYNINIIRRLSDLLGHKTRFIRQSELKHTQQSTALLIELVKAVGATAYLSGDGAGGYLEENLFATAGVDLLYQQYNEPVRGHEVQGLSVLHTLFHDGVRG